VAERHGPQAGDDGQRRVQFGSAHYVAMTEAERRQAVTALAALLTYARRQTERGLDRSQ
jgi:hypothetical protein